MFAFEAAQSLPTKNASPQMRITTRQIECAILVGKGLTEGDIAVRVIEEPG
jgi:hypothetical protein